VFLGYWNDGGGPDRYRTNRTVTLTVDSASAVPATSAAATATAFSAASATAAAMHTAAPITQATEYRIDEGNANPLLAWKQMGSPNPPSTDQLAELIAASEVTPRTLRVSEGTVVVEMSVNSAVLVVLQ
jgi:beta-xylosidase